MSRRWSSTAALVFGSMARRGESVADIAAHFDRSEDEILKRMARFGLAPVPPREIAEPQGTAWRRLEEGWSNEDAARDAGYASVGEMLEGAAAYGRRVCNRATPWLYDQDLPRLDIPEGATSDRAVLAYRLRMQGLTYAEIAAEMGWASASSVSNAIKRLDVDTLARLAS